MKSLLPIAWRRIVGGCWNNYCIREKNRALLRKLKGTGTTCNVCHWEGRAFTDDQWHPGTICPRCGSQVRHRLLTAVFDSLSCYPQLNEKRLLENREILHFAPERQLRERITRVALHYRSADFIRGDCDLRLDVSAMPEVGDSSCHTLIACDVLEHVPDDFAAFREIYRVLKPGGTAILAVPQMDSPSRTDEDPQIRSEQEREQRFGQKDHVRMYGDDFLNRLEDAGFSVITVMSSSFSPAIVTSYVLHPPVLSRRHLATNQRRIYFASKAAS